MRTIRSDVISDETFENLELWRAKQDPPQDRPFAISMILKTFFQEHEKELKKYRIGAKQEKETI